MLKKVISKRLSQRTKNLLVIDYYRWKARNFGKKSDYKDLNKLHLGCGKRRVEGWLNVDLMNSDYDVDLGCGTLPFKNSSFNKIVSQHVIEHLELDDELLPLLKECFRILSDKGEIWLSCPDMEKVCNSYFEDKALSLINDRKERWPDFEMPNFPSQQMVNMLFHQGGTHKNLFDFELLSFLLEKVGFKEVRKSHEAEFLNKNSDFPPRHDDKQSLYVVALKDSTS